MTDQLPDADVFQRTAAMAPVAVELLMRNVRGASEAALQEYLLPILSAQADQGVLVEAALALVGYTVGTAGGLARDARLVGFHPEKWLRDYAATLSGD